MSNTRINKWKVPRTVHVTEMGPTTDSATLIWVVLHGYAQDVEALIPEFEEIAQKDQVFLPEGMSKFYRKGYEGEVVSSWMTSRHRLDEITDQQHYLNSVYSRIPTHAAHKLVVLGFSQGTATAIRWLEQNHPVVNSLVVYAGWPPEDVDYTIPYWSSLKHLYVVGDEDYFLPPERLAAMRELDYYTHCQPSELHFNGPHEVSKEVLKKIRASLISS